MLANTKCHVYILEIKVVNSKISNCQKKYVYGYVHFINCLSGISIQLSLVNTPHSHLDSPTHTSLPPRLPYTHLTPT